MDKAQLSRRTVLATGAAALALSGCQTSLPSTTPAFITRDGQRFLRGGEPYRYVGANAWYLSWLGADTGYGDPARLTRELDRMKAAGITNLRVLAGAEQGPLTNSIKPGYINEAGELNLDLPRGLDRVLAEMAARDMTAVLYFSNFWEWSGGMMTRLYYATGEYMNMNDPAHPWPEFPDAASAFYASDEARAGYADHVARIVSRVNTITGVPYKDDPTIMAWQLANEPRPGGTDAMVEQRLPDYYDWIDTTAAQIRALDPNHLVSLGMEGTQGANGREDVVLRAHENIDYLTGHIWPQNWGWADPQDLAGTWETVKRNTEDYIAVHERLARDMNKPLVFEEFGFPRDDESYEPGTPATYRRKFYEILYEAAERSLAEGGPIAGTNFWAWNGEARAEHGDYHFRDGDVNYMGDPPHEPQGWYGNFDSDDEMLALIRSHAEDFATG